MAKFEIPDHLPFDFPLPGNIDAYVDLLQPKHVKDALQIWTMATSTGDGFAVNETETEASLLSYNKQGKGSAAYVIIDKKNDTLIAVDIIIPSGQCRSTNPLYAGGFIVVNKPYRGAIGKSIMSLSGAFERKVYHGGLHRSNILARSVRLIKDTGGYFLGIVPDCTYLKGKGQMDDVFNVTDPYYMDRKKDSEELANGVVIPPLHPIKVEDSRVSAKVKFPQFSSFPDLHHSGTTMSVTFADLDDTIQVEKMIRQAASDGDGFAVDEFLADGTFNRKWLRQCFVAVVKTKSGEIQAAVLFGSNRLCRTEGREVGGYVMVAPRARRRGLGRVLIKYCLEAARDLGYRTVLTDVLSSNLKVLTMAQREGFIVTATLPNVALVRGHGYVNTYVVWRPLYTDGTTTATSRL